LNARNGFTLVEVLAASALSTIVAGALLTFLHMTNGQIKEGSSHLRLVQLQDVVSEQLRISAHKACRVTAESDDPITSFDPIVFTQGIPPALHKNEIRFYDKGVQLIAKYHVNSIDGYLEEWDPIGARYLPFRVGDDTVFVNAARSEFNLYSGRAGLSFTIAYQSKDGSDTIPVIAEGILCRNTGL
jgi:prepilin-type N-terminal cleavage/methylation domain-containing protein